MAGGKRTGGGRKRGAPNKATAARQAAVEASGLTPLDYLLGIMRDETADQGLWLEAARTASEALTLGVDEDEPLRMVSRIELVPVEPRPRVLKLEQA